MLDVTCKAHRILVFYWAQALPYLMEKLPGRKQSSHVIAGQVTITHLVVNLVLTYF